MGGTKIGGLRAAQTNKRVYGPQFYAHIGRLGGEKRVPKGFALMSPEQRREAGRKGGSKSRRGKRRQYATV